jgi:glycosyltransferase involved in cell wall biosynthesis
MLKVVMKLNYMNTLKENIILFGGIPPPMTGAAVSNKFVYEILKEHYNVYLLNTSVGYNKPKNDIISNFKYNVMTLFVFTKKVLLLAKVLKENKIHAFYFLPSCNLLGHIKDIIILSLFGEKLGKIVGQVHNSNFNKLFDKGIYKIFTHIFYQKVSVLIYSSKELAEEGSKFIVKDRITYFKNTINPKVFCSNFEIENKLSSRISSSHFEILFVGHMFFSKGCFDLLKAAKLLRLNNCNNFKVTFIGGWSDDVEEMEFNTFLKSNNMEDYVNCLGIIQDPIILKGEYLKSDIFVLPTYYPYESQPLAIIDAMNAANPIISTNQGTISEFVISGNNGYIVDKHSPQQISESIETLMGRKLWLELAKQARRDFELNFSLSAYKTNLLNIIE